ncbi:MAG: SpoIVB peptidase S55 domain-containing protein [Bacilli bacterium]
MIFKKFKKSSFLLLLLIIPFSVSAYSPYLIPGGENIGIELKSNGIIVAGTYLINNFDPAKEAGIIKGDIITSIDDTNINSINELVLKVNSNNNGIIKIGYVRNDISKYTNLKLYKQNDTYKTGLYIKDSIIGIGTLSFIDPNTLTFGALGHEIIEKTTGKIFNVKDGKIFESTVVGIIPSTNGTPGEKNAKYFSDKINGKVNENSNKGIFGKYTNKLPQKKQYKVANSNDIKAGEAVIRTVLSADVVKEFTINILKLNNSTKTKNILFEITDEELLNKTNGIVQGMSGSPILQDDFIIGAVTHVVVDNPTKGYGIFITNMLEEAEN